MGTKLLNLFLVVLEVKVVGTNFKHELHVINTFYSTHNVYTSGKFSIHNGYCIETMVQKIFWFSTYCRNNQEAVLLSKVQENLWFVQKFYYFVSFHFTAMSPTTHISERCIMAENLLNFGFSYLGFWKLCSKVYIEREKHELGLVYTSDIVNGG